MSYTTPPTFVASDVLAAADLNILSDDIIDLDARANEQAFMGVSLVRSSNQSTSTATLTDLSWTSANLDVGSWWTSGTDIVVPAGAIPSGFTTIYVEIHGQTRAATNATGSRTISFLLNGSTIEDNFSAGALAADPTTIQHTVWAEVAAADVLKMQVSQNSGGSLNWSNSSWKVKRLGPAS